MRATTHTRRLTALLTLCGALACADSATAPMTARPAASRVGLATPDARRAAVRVLAVTDLRTLGAPYDARSEAWRINDAGQVAGVSGAAFGHWTFERYVIDGSTAAFRWQSGTFTDISELYRATAILPTGITDGGTVALADRPERDSFLWNASASRLDGVPSGCNGIAVTDANDAGVASGVLFCDDLATTLGVWLPGGPWQAIPRATSSWPTSAIFAGGFAVNRGGDVVGAVPTADGASVVPVLVTTTPGISSMVLDCRPTCRRGWARDVSDRRWIVGAAEWSASVGAMGAFVWTPAGGFEPIPPLPGDTESAAYGVNAWNQVVGYSWSAARVPHAFLWTRRGGTQPLDPLVAGTGSKALGINDVGRVVGSSGSYAHVYSDMNADRTRAVMWRLETIVVSLLTEGNPGLADPGNLRLAVLGGGGFDPTHADPRSLRLGDEVGLDTAPAVDGKGSPLAYAKDANGDGVVDLVVEFPVPALVKNGDLTKATTELLLTGTTGQGAAVIGAAKVTVVP